MARAEVPRAEPRAPRAATRARQAELVALLHRGVTAVEDLSERLGVSASTVRRDLERLDRAGEVTRTLGGAIAPPPFTERPVAESAGRRREAKHRIATTASSLVPRTGQVFVDAGTTCAALAAILAREPTPAQEAPGAGRGTEDQGDRLTVVTRGLETAVALADAEHVDVVLIGGRLRPLSHGLVGPLGSLALERMGFDVAFLGADVVDPARGIGEPTVEETVVKEQVAAVAARTVVLADATKLDAGAAPAWTRLDGGWSLAVDEERPGLRAACGAHGVDLLVADA